ncbi:MAG: sigma-70 family RNA polymerase sigma factor [Planctomycetes bacterium]|nr:sigma-70 family RNA polymerase sigma factor [Planctomycetota bacterium]
MTFTSRALVEAASRGDGAAIDELVVACLPRLHAYVRLRMGAELRGREASVDIAQSVCREILASLGEDRFVYRGERAFLHYVFECALNKIRQRHRTMHRQRRDVDREVPVDAGATEPLAALDSVSRDVVAREELDLLEAAFARLPDHYREVLTKSRILGLSTHEIAESMGRSDQAVRNLIGRALRMLARTHAPR